MSEEVKKQKVFNVVSTNKYIVLSNEDKVIEISRGGHSRADGVKFDIGVSFQDINEERTRRKLSKVVPKLQDKEIDAIVKKNRLSVVSMYKKEVLNKLTEVGAEADTVEAVENELKIADLAKLLR